MKDKQISKNEDTISVIVPVWNVEKFLPQCIESIINQTYKEIELILIDDGSTDDSGYICDKYAEMDCRVVVHHSRNKGVSNARNIGIEVANGDWIMFVDSDDWLGEHYIEDIVKEGLYKRGDVYISGGHIKEYSDKTLEWKCFKKLEIKDDDNRDKMIGKMLSPLYYRIDGTYDAPLGEPWAKIYRADFLKNNDIRFNMNFHPYEDVLFHYTVFSSASIIGGDVIGYHYRYINGSSTNKYNSKYVSMMNDFILISQEFINKRNNSKELMIALYARIIIITGWLCRVCFFSSSHYDSFKSMQVDLNNWKKKQVVFDALITKNKYLSLKQKLLQKLLKMNNNYVLFLIYSLKNYIYNSRLLQNN